MKLEGNKTLPLVFESTSILNVVADSSLKVCAAAPLNVMVL